jgi:D-aminoacyl-tRNA deacylase
MRAVIQRVRSAQLTINEQIHAGIDRGLVVLLGVGAEDVEADASWLAVKTLALRIFPDGEGRMNRSVVEAGGDLLVVSQFTLFADTKKGNRPSFTRGAPPDRAKALYEFFADALRGAYDPSRVRTGVFAADMLVALENEGPVTIVLDSRQRDF